MLRRWRRRRRTTTVVAAPLPQPLPAPRPCCLGRFPLLVCEAAPTCRMARATTLQSACLAARH
eukprot:9155589-Alexandrium_andersonii.AAC.1